MLKGTNEELQYHETRAAQELARASHCEDAIAANAHRNLADFHGARVILVHALREKRANGKDYRLCRTDKEA